MNLSEVSLRTKDAFWNVQKTPIDSTEELGRFARFVADQTGLLGVEPLLADAELLMQHRHPQEKRNPEPLLRPGVTNKILASSYSPLPSPV